MTVPFLNLPFLLQIMILKELSLLQLFHFSLLSRRCKTIVKWMNVSLSELHWNIKKTKKHQIFVKDSSSGDEFLLDFEPRSRPDYDNHVIITTGRMSRTDSLELLDQLTRCLMEVFKVQRFALKTDCLQGFGHSFVWKYTRTFESFCVEHSEGRLSQDELKFIMEELKINEFLSLGSCVREGVKYSGPLRARDLHVPNGFWLTLESILSMDCERLRAGNVMLTAKDLNTIMKKWLSGGLKNLVWISFELPYAKLDDILEGIEARFLSITSRTIHRIDGIQAIVDLDYDCRFKLQVGDSEITDN